MDWTWRREGRCFVAELPTWIGAGTVRAEATDEGWALQVGDWHDRIVNPRLTTWITAREVVEIVVRSHFCGAAAVNSTGVMMIGARAS